MIDFEEFIDSRTLERLLKHARVSALDKENFPDFAQFMRNPDLSGRINARAMFRLSSEELIDRRLNYLRTLSSYQNFSEYHFSDSFYSGHYDAYVQGLIDFLDSRYPNFGLKITKGIVNYWDPDIRRRKEDTFEIGRIESRDQKMWVDFYLPSSDDEDESIKILFFAIVPELQGNFFAFKRLCKIAYDALLRDGMLFMHGKTSPSSSAQKYDFRTSPTGRQLMPERPSDIEGMSALDKAYLTMGWVPLESDDCEVLSIFLPTFEQAVECKRRLNADKAHMDRMGIKHAGMMWRHAKKPIYTKKQMQFLLSAAA